MRIMTAITNQLLATSARNNIANQVVQSFQMIQVSILIRCMYDYIKNYGNRSIMYFLQAQNSNKKLIICNTNLGFL